MPTLVFGQRQSIENSDFIHLNQRAEKSYESVEEIFELISLLNNDPECVGIMIQLPLPEQFAEYKLKLLQAIAESKDIDGLGGSLVGKSFFEMLEFTPATPRAVLSLLDYYQLGDLRGKSVAIIGQSTIVGKPLALACLQRGARVQCFDIRNTPAELKK